MKKLGIILFILVIASAGTVQAKIWRVNNSGSDVSADTNSVQAAHNIAAAGDTIHVEASMTSYGNLTLSKRLVIIGTGIFLGENPETQANFATSKVDAILFNAGSQGTIICGLDIMNYTDINVNDICLMRNKIDLPVRITLGGTYSNIIIKQNYISQSTLTTNSFFLVGGGTFVTNLIITNNYFFQVDPYYPVLSLTANVSGEFMNNVVRCSGTICGLSIQNFNIQNNIMIDGTVSFTNCNVTNNIGNLTQFGTLNGNQSNVNMTDVFVGATGNSSDGQYQLKVGSPAIGAGFNGADCGIFGGAEPYILSCIPPVPAIYYFNTYGSGNQQYIEIKAKARE